MSLRIDFSELIETLNHLTEQIEDPPWALTITRIDNGYVLCGNDIDLAVEDDDDDELKSHEELLWNIIEYFNFGGSSHDPERLKTIREKQ